MILSIFNYIICGFRSIGAWIETNSDFLTAAATVAIAAFTLTLWRATVKLWTISQQQSKHMETSIAIAIEAADAANRSAQIAEDALISGQRAFVFVDTIVYPNPLDHNFINNFWRINVIWKNSGLTPTRNLMSNINWGSFINKIPNDFDFPDAVDREPLCTCIGPKAIIHSDYVDIPVTFFNGQNHVYVWGWVDYNDVFDETPRHRTEFCYEIIMNWAKRFDPQVGMRLRPHHKHNGADNECHRKPAPYVPPS